MTSSVAPIVFSETVPLTAVSTSFPIPNVNYSHVMLCATKDMWLAVGGPSVVAVPGAPGAMYIPANTFIEVPTRRQQVDGITHYAVIKVGMGFDGILNLNFGHQVITDTDLLMNIHSCLMHMLHIHQGVETHPHYPCEQLTHIDVLTDA